jgi:prepilin-type N-terminal cleavage/methylation domain-containing protein
VSRRRRAFSLLEVMVASAIAGVVLAAVTTISTSIQRSLAHQRDATLLEEQGELLEEFFAPILRQMGQRTIRPWEAVRTTCSAAPCLDAELHWIDLRDGMHLTPTNSWNGAPATLSFDVVEGLCPLDPSLGWASGEHTVVLLPEDSTQAGWQEMRCTPTLATCSCALTAMPTTVATSTVPSNGWGRPRVAPGSTVTLRRNASQGELVIDRDLDGDGEREIVRLTNDVYGVSFGFGLRDDTTGETTFLPLLDPTRPTALRMLRLELAVGVRTEHPQAGQPVTLGSEVVAGVPGVLLRRSATTVALPTAVGL